MPEITCLLSIGFFSFLNKSEFETNMNFSRICSDTVLNTDLILMAYYLIAFLIPKHPAPRPKMEEDYISSN